MLPGNYPTIRPATAADAHVLRALAVRDAQAPLTGRVLVAELRGKVVAAISREDRRVVADRERTPTYVTSRLRLDLGALEAVEREPRLNERMRAAVLGPRDADAADLPLAA